MGSYTVYLVGFRENDLSADEQKNLDTHISKWGSGWSGNPYKPLDSRNPSFNDIASTFADEPRSDGKKIIIYQEIMIEKSEKDKVIQAFNDMKSVLPGAILEAHDEGGKIS